MSNLLALDQATRTTGYAIFKDGKLIKTGTFTFSDNEIGDRLVKFKNKVLELISEYDIDEIAFEDIQLQDNKETKVVNVDTFQKLAEVFGVLEETLTEHKMPYQIISASTWKSKCGIKGKERAEQKKNAQLYVQNKYNLKIAQDACDAICIGECGAGTYMQELNWE